MTDTLLEHDRSSPLPSDNEGDSTRTTLGRSKTSRSGSWTDIIPRTEHNTLFLDADYSHTTLGPKESWGTALQLYASMVFADSRGAGVYWGPNKTCFYNDKFAPCLGRMHPSHMGQGLYETFPEVGASLEPAFQKAVAIGQTVDVDNILLFMERNGYVEETYFVGQYIPLRGDSGAIEGLYNTVFETTAQKLHERRRPVIDLITSIPPLSTEETLRSFMEALKTNPLDIPAAVLYSYDETADEGSLNLRLQGSIGVPADHASTPLEACVESDGGLFELFRKVKITGKPFVLSRSEEDCAKYLKLFDGLEWGGYGEPSRDVVVTPLAVGDHVLGFFVHGTNPRRPYDEASVAFLIDLKTQLETKWIASLSREATERRQHILEQRASVSERRLRNLAQSAPVGMIQIGTDAKFEWANDQFYDITGLDRSKVDMADFRNILADDERATSLASLERLLSGSTPRVTQEHRLARLSDPPVEEDEDVVQASAWILSTFLPVMESGRVTCLLGYIMDISHQKWAEGVQSRNAAAARLAKRRQEEFIDVTCHEMRNPLSAITQLADGIASSVNGGMGSWQTTAEAAVTAASTILTCAAHQKRVIDDVLTLSRLDFELLSINPVPYQPSKAIEFAIRMFDAEVKMKGTEISARRDWSVKNVTMDYALIDPSRLQQILINLISNAIKFVASEHIRKITVTYGATTSVPPHLPTSVGEIIWNDVENIDSPLTADSAEQQPKLYLYFIVQDTGPGIRADQVKKLFKRFSQAGSRSHVSYGGSGLGLYISRQLVEKQGGKVGVASKEGNGTAFAFYITSRLAHSQSATPSSTQSDRAVAEANMQVEPEEFIPVVEALAPQTRQSEEMSLPIRIERPLASTGTAEPKKGIHILLVEDNLINQRVLAQQLRARECTVTVANHGQEALDLLEQAGCWDSPSTSPDGRTAAVRIDVVLMDVEMPVMDGLQCTKRIRELEIKEARARKLPIIAVTANVRQEHQDTVFAAGMDDFLPKPVTISEVLKRIEEVMTLAEYNHGLTKEAP